VSGGKAAEQRRLEELVRACEAGDIDVIYVQDWSRFSREEPLKALRTLGRIHDAGARLVGALDGFDSGSEHGAIVAAASATTANAYLRQVGERWRYARRHAFARGVPVAPVPLGYRREEGRLAVDPVSSRIVREVFERRARGEAYTAIARALDMSRSTVKYVLANEAYAGVLRQRIGGEELVAECPAIVERGLFDSVQATRTTSREPDRRKGEPPLLRGLVVCAGCGRKMVGRHMRDGRRPSYYDSNSTGCADRASAYQDELDAQVESEFLDSLNRAGGALAEAFQARSRAAEAQAAVEEAERGLTEYLRLVGSGLDAALVAEELERRQGLLEIARASVSEALAASRAVDSLELPTDLREAWPSLSVVERRRLLAAAIDRVEVRRGGEARVFWRGGVVAEPEARMPVPEHGKPLAADVL
jgi:DNA invertase Pin-like site-specific DNA recombinase